jgi:hypothetical protein
MSCGIFNLVSCVLKVKYLIQFSLQLYRNIHAYVKNSVPHISARNQQPDSQSGCKRELFCRRIGQHYRQVGPTRKTPSINPTVDDQLM